MKLGIHLWVGVLLTASVMVCPGQQWQIQTLAKFATPPNSPHGGLVAGADGNFYGTTTYGGDYNNGTIFRLTPAGNFTLLASFDGTNGAYPVGSLVSHPNGALYGVTIGDGNNNSGTVFQVTTNGMLTCLAALNRATNGGNATAGLTLGADGNLYGTTMLGGPGSGGTVFKITPDGTLSVLAVLGSAAPDRCANPQGALVLGPDDCLYGTTVFGGSNIIGTAFKISTNGDLTPLASFTYAAGNSAFGLTLGADGNFYSACHNGGDYNQGSLVRFDTNGTLTLLASFDRTNTGAQPWGQLLAGADGRLYGTTTRGGSNNCGTMFALTTNGDLSVVAELDSITGSSPLQSTLLQTAAGTIYGMATRGGADAGGTIFQLTPDHTLTPVFSFDGMQGAEPVAELAVGQDGKYYGTTFAGGVNGSGTAFSLATNGTLQNLFRFDYFDNCGRLYAGLLPGTDGNFYGVAQSGGSQGNGVIFRLSPQGDYTEIGAFSSTLQMDTPQGTLVQGPDNYLYGTARDETANGASCIFKCSTSGSLTRLVSTGGGISYAGLMVGQNGNLYGTRLAKTPNDAGAVYRFDRTSPPKAPVLATFQQTNGAAPYGSLVQTSDGHFYGTTRDGGDYNLGTVFKLSAAGVLTSLLSFDGTNGANPYAGLVVGTDGQLYGSTSAGGNFNCGSIYTITTNGALTTLATFDGTNGAAPYARLTPGGDGWLYGSTRHGGTGGGTLFRLVPRITLSLGNPQPDGSRQLAGTGPAGYACRIWSSSDLSLPLGSWTLVTNTVCDEAGNFGGTDAAGAVNQIQFYRASIP